MVCRPVLSESSWNPLPCRSLPWTHGPEPADRSIPRSGRLVGRQLLTLYTTPVVHLYFDHAEVWLARTRAGQGRSGPVSDVQKETVSVPPDAGSWA